MNTLTIASINAIYDRIDGLMTKEDLNKIVVGLPNWVKEMDYDEDNNIRQIVNKNKNIYIRRDFEYNEQGDVEQIAYYLSKNFEHAYEFIGIELYDYDSNHNLIKTSWFTDEYHRFAKLPVIQSGLVSVNITPEIKGTSPIPGFLNNRRLYRKFQIIEDGGTFLNPLVSIDLNSNSWTLDQSLMSNQMYKVRIADVYPSGQTEWSNVVTFQTTDTYVETPEILVEGAPDEIGRNPELTGSVYNLTDTDTSDYHIMTDWKIIKVSDGSVAFESLGDESNLVSIQLPEGVLDSQTEYQFMLRYKSVYYGYSSWGSQFYLTGDIYVIAPEMTIEGAPNNVPKTPEWSTDDFSVFGDSDTHISTDWRITRTSDNYVVFESLEDASNLTEITLPYEILEAMTEYRFEVRHRGAVYGASNWTQQIVTTENEFFGNLFAAANNEIRKIYTTYMSYSDNYDEHTDNITSMIWGKDNNLYSSAKDNSIHKINPVTMTQIDSYTHLVSLNVVISGGDGYLYAGCNNNEVHKINPDTMSLVSKYVYHTGSVVAMAWGGDGYLYSGDTNNEIHKIDPSIMTVVEEYTGHDDEITSLAWGGDGYLYSTSKDDEVHQIDPDDMTQVAAYTGHIFTVNSVVWGQGYLYSASNSYVIHKIDPSDMSLVDEYDSHSDEVLDLVWGGNYLYSASKDTEVHQIDVSDMSMNNSFTQFLNPVNSLSWDKTIWDNYDWTIDSNGVVTSYGSDPGPDGRTY